MSSSTSELTAVIQTKLHHPKIPINLVSRPCLIVWLDERRQCPITLVSAPAWQHYGSSLTVLFIKNLYLMKTIRHRIKRSIWCVVPPVTNLCNWNEPSHPLDAGLPDLSFPGQRFAMIKDTGYSFPEPHVWILSQMLKPSFSRNFPYADLPTLMNATTCICPWILLQFFLINMLLDTSS